MKSFDNIIIYILTLFIIGMSSCAEEEIVKGTPGDGKTLRISIAALSQTEIVSTKATQSDAADIKELCVLIYDATNGEIISNESQYYDGNSTMVTALNSNSAAKTTVEITMQIAAGQKVLRLLSGCGDVRNESAYSSLTKLEQMTFPLREGNLPKMISYGEGDKTFDVATTSETVTANLERIYSMVTVVIANNVNGATITPKTVKLCHVPTTGTLAAENRIPRNPSSDKYVEIADNLTFGENWSHDNKATPAFFMYENMQGVNENDDQTKKTPPSIGKPTSSLEAVKADKTCSYIEVTTEYKGTKEGTVTYRFFLGADITQNFDVRRNTHYKVTLTLSGDGGIEEGSWRVETDLMSDFTVEDVYIGFKKGSISKGALKYGDNDDFFKSCIWSIDDVTPATGTMLGNAKADQGDFITHERNGKTLTFNTSETNVYERWPRYKKYKITATKTGKSVSKTINVFQVTRIIDPIGYYKKANNTKTEDIEVKEFDLATNFYKTINSSGAWTAKVVAGESWVRLGKYTSDEDVSVNKNVVTGTGGNVRFTYTPQNSTTNPRYGCILVKYHNNQCEHKIYLRQGNAADVALMNNSTVWSFGNLVENSEAGTQGNTYGIAEFATQPGPLFKGGSNLGVSSYSPGYGQGYPNWGSAPSAQWGNTGTGSETNQGPCPKGYRLPSVRDFTVLRQQFFDNSETFVAVAGYLHDDDDKSGWNWSGNSVNLTGDALNHSNPAKGTLLVNEDNNFVNLFFPFGNGIFVHKNGTIKPLQNYDSGLDEIGVGWRDNGKLIFTEDYKPIGSEIVSDYDSYGGAYWSGNAGYSGGSASSSHALYMKFWYFLNRDVPVYVSDGSNRWGISRGVNKSNAQGVTRNQAMFVRCVKTSLIVDQGYWNNN